MRRGLRYVAAMSPSVEELIEHLQLIPHPEGGYFREVFRSGSAPMVTRGATDPDGRVMDTSVGPRNILTSIYWMVTRASPIGWLCINGSDHIHYHHAGESVTYHVISPEGQLRTHRLGADVARGEVMQLVVPGGYVKAAELTQGAYGLLGEAVAPGFDFQDFTFISEDELRSRFPQHLALLRFVKPDRRRDFERYYDADVNRTP